MADIYRTNICCLDLTQECIDYLKSLNMNVYQGSLGSVFSIDWDKVSDRSVYVFPDVDFPSNWQEYHVFVQDMENPRHKNFDAVKHHSRCLETNMEHYLRYDFPVSTFDIRPYGSYLLSNQFNSHQNHRRIEILFVGKEVVHRYKYKSIRNEIEHEINYPSDLEFRNWVEGKMKCGNRVQLVDNDISKLLFDSRKHTVAYYRTFSHPMVMIEGKRVPDESFQPLLNNEEGECVAYMNKKGDGSYRIALPQVKDKAGLLKDLFENVLFRTCSDFFPDIEARSWIHSESYQLPDEIEIQRKIKDKRDEYEQAMALLEEEAKVIREKNSSLKQLLTESGSALVASVKSFLEWMGFENVIDKDETLKKDELKEEDLCFEYEGNLILIEVKGIHGTSTDAECSQIDKVVNRRMRELKTTDVHGVYVVNHQRSVEPLKRQMPPFNETQMKDAVNQSRTLVYTTQLFALHSDIENGFITKEQARKDLLQTGLVQFHTHLTSLGIPYDYYQGDTVVCLDLHHVAVSVGDTLCFEDPLQRLVGRKVMSIQQENTNLDSVDTGRTGIKLDGKVPRNRELFINEK